MGLLPKNEPTEKDITPKMFFIWGQSMSGKTYLARQFPNPVILNTDGNAKKVDTPSVEIKDFETFVKTMSEMEKGGHGFETVIVDLVDDIQTMLEIYVMKKYNIEALADAPFGKAYSDVKTTWKTLMVRLSQMPYNVVFISHITEKQDESDSSRTIEVPSLAQKFYNMTMGRCDLSIKCRKLGNNYIQMVVDKRDVYTVDDMQNKVVTNILMGIKGAISEKEPEAPKPVAKKTGSTSKVTKKPRVAQSSATEVTEEPKPEPKAEPETKTMASVADKRIKKLKSLKK